MIDSAVVKHGAPPDGIFGAQTATTWWRLAILLASCALLSVLFWDRPELLVSSDSLLPAAFVHDVLHPAGPWRAFHHARVPSFVPDLVLFGGAQIVFGSWRVAMAIWTFAVLASLAIVASRIVRQLARVESETATLIVLSILLPTLTAALWNFPWFDGATDSRNAALPYLGIVIPFSHGGPFVLALIAACVAREAMVRPSAVKTATLCLLAFALGVSDLLCVTSLLAPMTAAALGGWFAGIVPLSAGITLLFRVWASAGLGWVATLLLDRQPLPLPARGVIPDNILHFLTDLGQYPGLLIVALALALLLTWDIHRRGLRVWIADFWPVFAASSAAAALVAAMVNYEDIFSAHRYAMPFFWWPIILAAAALAEYCRKRPLLPRLGAAAGIGAVALSLAAPSWMAPSWMAPGWRAPRLFGWEAPLSSCVRQIGPRAGLADYWNARSLAAASDWRLQIDQITPLGGPYLWGNNPYWYTHDIQDASRPPPYGFVVMERLSPDRIAAVFGPPDHVTMCGTVPVWIYDDPARLAEPLQNFMSAREAAIARARSAQ